MIDRKLPLKKEISNNIKRLMNNHNWTQVKLSEECGISKSTLSDYINCKTLINHRNVEKLSEAFKVPKSEIDPSYNDLDIIEQHQMIELTEKDERDIQKKLQETINDFDEQTIEDIDEEDIKLLIASLENTLRLAKRIAKQKFTPKKYRK